MKGIDRIKNQFEKNDKLKLMTHVVGGYPDMKTCEEIIVKMAEKGVDIVEVQLPFSDPPADGPIIVAANHDALSRGVTTEDVLDMISRVRKRVDIPLLIMSYINPLYKYGVEKIIEKALGIGVDGFIIPDLPPEEPELNIPNLCRENGLALVPLIAPSTTDERMKKLTMDSDSPFVYAVLRLGVTGRKTELDSEAIDYLKRIKDNTGRLIAGGFGIRDKDQLNALNGHAECGIIGSALLTVVNNAVDQGDKPIDRIEAFLEEVL